MECIMVEVANKEWEDRVKAMLKAELKRKGVTYAQLVGKLADIGVMDSEPNIRNKLARGKFTAVFLIQCLEAIGTSSLRLSDS
jgi:microsomal dipeptidase-like Zn-dependent dipeptidase